MIDSVTGYTKAKAKADPDPASGFLNHPLLKTAEGPSTRQRPAFARSVLTVAHGAMVTLVIELGREV